MRSFFVLSFMVMLGTSVSHGAEFNGLDKDLARFLFRYLPLRTQVLMSATAKDYLNLFNEEGRKKHVILKADNTDEQLVMLNTAFQPVLITSLTLEDGLSDDQLNAIFESILDFGILLEAIDIQVLLNDAQLQTLCQLPKLSHLTIAKGSFDEQTTSAVVSLKDLKTLNFLASGKFTEAALAILFANQKLESLHLNSFAGQILPEAFLLPELQSLSLHGYSIPSFILCDASRQMPKLKKLVLNGLVQNCAFSAGEIDALLAMDMEVLEIQGQNIQIDTSCLSSLTKHFSGNIFFSHYGNNQSIKGEKFLPKNHSSHAHFYLEQPQNYAPLLPAILASATQDLLSIQLKNDDSVLAQELFKNFRKNEPCHEFNIFLNNQNSIQITRQISSNRQCSDRSKLQLQSGLSRVEELFPFWPEDDADLTVFIEGVVDLKNDLFLERNGINSLVLNSEQDLVLNLDSFNALTKNGFLGNLQLRARTLKITPELWPAMFELYRIDYSIEDKGHSLNLIRLDNSEGSNNHKYIRISFREVVIAQALKFVPNELLFMLHIENPIGKVDFNSFIHHPHLDYFVVIQKAPFIVTDENAEACMGQMKVRNFEILAPQVKYKNKLATQWDISKRDDHRGYRFDRNLHPGKNTDRIKSIIIKEGSLLEQIPRKGDFDLIILSTASIDMASLIEVLENPRLKGLRIDAEQLFTFDTAFVQAISNNGHINSINIEGRFIIEQNAFKHLSSFDHLGLFTDKSGKERLRLLRHPRAKNDEQGLSCSLSVGDSQKPLDALTLREIGKIQDLSSLRIDEGVKLDAATCQFFALHPNLKQLSISDLSMLAWLPRFKNLTKLGIHVQLDPQALLNVIATLKTCNIPIIRMSNMSADEKMKQDATDVILMGPGITDELFMEGFNMPTATCNADNENVSMPKIGLSLINTAVSVPALLSLAKAQKPALAMFNKLDLSSFQNITCADLLVIGEACINCEQITVPAHISTDELLSLHTQMPRIRFIK